MSKDPAPIDFHKLYISSTDTLCGRQLDQKSVPGWNDQPPLFKDAPNAKKAEEDETLLKTMIRSGIPPALRCSVWMSNILKICNPDEPAEFSNDYRTLGKVRQLDTAWAAAEHHIFSNESDRDDAVPPNFGNTDHLQYHENVSKSGKKTLTFVLLGLEHVLGLDFCPLLPTLTALLLRCMSESYAFYAVREMAHHSSWYFPVTQVEHHAWSCAFIDVLSRLHPQTARRMQAVGILNPKGLEPIFKYFFLPILPLDYVLRIVDVYTFEGQKVLFRFAVALLCLFGMVVRRDKLEIATAEQWWTSLKYWSVKLDFELLCRKAYGYHGNRLRKQLRFPRRHVLARIIKLEEERAMREMEFEEIKSPPKPLTLMENDVVVLAKPAARRAHLASWLPPSLRLNKLDLIFSTNVHGRSLEQFYRYTEKHNQTVLLCQVLNNNSVIGVFASQAWKSSSRFYGDGECFLFRLEPEPECWKWKPDPKMKSQSLDEDDSPDLEVNGAKAQALMEQFMIGRDNFISMGGDSGGGSGFRLNEDMTKGESATANGYNNDPLPGLANFEVGVVEVYRLAGVFDHR